MRIIFAAGIAGFFTAAPVMAQEDPSVGDTLRTVRVADSRPGSPSNGTSTVSPSSVPQSMNQLDNGSGPFSLSLGTLYATGDFGATSDTSIWSSALGARYRLGDFRVTASLPWMRIKSSASLFTGIDSTPVLLAPGGEAPRRTAKGFGDLTLGGAYTVASPASNLEFELSGRVKLNTAARSSGLSSGKTDYAAGIQITKPLGTLAPFVSATYRVLGDTVAYRLRNGVAASAGASIMLSSKFYFLASYHYSARATDLVDDAHEVFAGAVTDIPNTRLRLTGFGTAGLSRGAAAASAGLALSRDF